VSGHVASHTNSFPPFQGTMFNNENIISMMCRVFASHTT
jgi:hypothetical protein